MQAQLTYTDINTAYTAYTMENYHTYNTSTHASNTSMILNCTDNGNCSLPNMGSRTIYNPYWIEYQDNITAVCIIIFLMCVYIIQILRVCINCIKEGCNGNINAQIYTPPNYPTLPMAHSNDTTNQHSHTIQVSRFISIQYKIKYYSIL